MKKFNNPILDDMGECYISKRTPAEWQERTGITILDPDGWRRDGKSFDEPIDEDEWNDRMMESTIMGWREKPNG